MSTRTPIRRSALLLLCTLTLTLAIAAVAVVAPDSAPSSHLELSIADLDHRLQECQFVQELNQQRLDALPETSSLMKRIFAILFPFGPAVNSLLATAYISDFLLALCPADIDPASLSVMVAFAVGGLLGDTLLHLVPQTFLGEPHDAKAHFVLNDGNRNAVLGLFIFIGFAAFVAMDKTLRIVTGGSGDSHSHSHSHPHPRSSEWGAGAGTGAETSSDSSGLTRRKKGTLKHEEEEEGEEEEKKTGQGVKPSSLLNLISDFTHNITDGLAMSGAFYAGPLVGASTCFAVMLHEIPHEVGDFALLIQGGFTKWQAMGAQFITALGAFTGTLIGIAIQEYSASSSESSASSGGGSATGGVKMGEGIMGTDLRAGDLVLPFTAGTFLYVAFSAVPEILETGTNRRLEAVKAIKQGLAMATGFALMFFISE